MIDFLFLVDQGQDGGGAGPASEGEPGECEEVRSGLAAEVPELGESPAAQAAGGGSEAERHHPVSLIQSECQDFASNIIASERKGHLHYSLLPLYYIILHYRIFYRYQKYVNIINMWDFNFIR